MLAKANRSCWHSIEINENRCKQNKQRSHMQSKMHNERLNVDFITSNEITIWLYHDGNKKNLLRFCFFIPFSFYTKTFSYIFYPILLHTWHVYKHFNPYHTIYIVTLNIHITYHMYLRHFFLFFYLSHSNLLNWKEKKIDIKITTSPEHI